MSISIFLGQNIAGLLKESPYKTWPVERSYEDDLEEPIIHYVFPENGLELRCDRNDRISVIFLYFDKYRGFDESLFDVPFSWNRAQVQAHFGTPEKTGEKRHDPVLGECGSWDRFRRPEFTIRFEYRVDDGHINKITLMRNDSAP